MRTGLLAAALAAGAMISAPTAPASAQVIMTVNHATTGGMTPGACKSKARRVLDVAGIRYHDETASAIWGIQGEGSWQYMVVMYCLSTRDVVVFTAAGADRNQTQPLVDRMLDAWNRTQ